MIAGVLTLMACSRGLPQAWVEVSDSAAVDSGEALCPDSGQAPSDVADERIESDQGASLQAVALWQQERFFGAPDHGAGGAVLGPDLNPMALAPAGASLGGTLHAADFLAAAAPLADEVWIWWTPDQPQATRIWGPGQTHLGHAALASLDGDIMIVGADNWPQADGSRGQVFLFDHPTSDRPAEEADTVIAGQPTLGSGVLGQDLDGDGVQDLVVGAQNSHRMSGGAFIFLGPLPSGALSTDDADQVLIGDLDQTGWSLAGDADLNGDGLLDLALGAPAMRDSDQQASGGAYWVLDWQAPLEEAPRAVGNGHSGVGRTLVLGLGPESDLAALGGNNEDVFVLRPTLEGTQLLCEADLHLVAGDSDALGGLGAVEGTLWVAASDGGNGVLYLFDLQGI